MERVLLLPWEEGENTASCSPRLMWLSLSARKGGFPWPWAGTLLPLFLSLSGGLSTWPVAAAALLSVCALGGCICAGRAEGVQAAQALAGQRVYGQHRGIDAGNENSADHL